MAKIPRDLLKDIIQEYNNDNLEQSYVARHTDHDEVLKALLRPLLADLVAAKRDYKARRAILDRFLEEHVPKKEKAPRPPSSPKPTATAAAVASSSPRGMGGHGL